MHDDGLHAAIAGFLRRQADPSPLASRPVAIYASIAKHGDGTATKTALDDAEARVLGPLREGGKVAVTPPKRHRQEPRDDERVLDQARHRIGNCFCTLKQYRTIATRYDTTGRHFLAGVALAATAILLH